jgi:hypothetical protein
MVDFLSKVIYWMIGFRWIFRSTSVLQMLFTNGKHSLSLMKEIQCGNISISYFHRNVTMKNNSAVKPLNSMQRHVSEAFSLHSFYPHHFTLYFYRNYFCSIALLCTPGSQRYNHNNTYLTLYNPKPQECKTFLYYHNFTVIRNDWHINTKLFLRSS